MAKEEKSVAGDLINFLNASPTAFHAVDEAKRRLKVAGYEQIFERGDWNLQAGKKYFFTRNYSTIVAFAIGKKYVAGNGFHIVGAHTDSPCLKLKPVSKVSKAGYLEVGVQTYGGGLWHTWFDRDLTIAGRMIIKEGKGDSASYSHRLVRLEEPIMRIPTLAIHLDRGVNDGFKVNAQTHLAPILATSVKAELNKVVADNGPDGGKPNESPNAVSNQKHHSLLLQMLATQAGCKPDDICDFELQACDTQPSIIAGAMKEFIFSGRLDNLCMSFCSLKALIDATVSEKSLEDESGVRMVALFDHEEVGSSSAQGAGSPVMFDALNRITTFFSSNPQLKQSKTSGKIDILRLANTSQGTIGANGQVFIFDNDAVRLDFTKFVIQQALPFNHFDNVKLTEIIKRRLQQRLFEDATKRQRTSAPTSELGQYMATNFLITLRPEEFTNFDILAWWKEREIQFPILSAMARDLLTVQASTVASESAFSISGRIISERRSRLTPESVEVCVCLKDYLDGVDRVQHETSLEGPILEDVEETIAREEVELGISPPNTELENVELKIRY
ncbi:probable aspartyl aminopeptidase [Tanacetum coccineum]